MGPLPIQAAPCLQPVPGRTTSSLWHLPGFGRNAQNRGDLQTHLLILQGPQDVGAAWRGLGTTRHPLKQGRTRRAHTEPWACPDAYLGCGNGEGPAGRWRGAACCRTAPRGWACSGRFRCLQAEEQGQRAEGGREAEQSISSVEAYSLRAPSPLPGEPPEPSAQGRECGPHWCAQPRQRNSGRAVCCCRGWCLNPANDKCASPKASLPECPRTKRCFFTTECTS